VAKNRRKPVRDSRCRSWTRPGVCETATSKTDFARSTPICVVFMWTPPPFLASQGRDGYWHVGAVWGRSPSHHLQLPARTFKRKG